MSKALYKTQKEFYRESYRTGIHGWPIHDPTPDVVRYIKKAKKRLRKKKPTAIDIGCGEGRHSIVLSKEGFNTLAVDYIKEAINKARKFSRKAGATKITFKHMDFINSRTKQQFDLAIDSGVFHHILVKDQLSYLKKVHDTINEGGYFIITCFSVQTKKYFNLKMKRNWQIHLGHYDRFFTKKELSGLLSKYFKVIELKQEKADSAMLHAFCYKQLTD